MASSSGAPPEKKRKEENRKFNSEWTDQFCFFMPEGSNAKPLCLICNRTVSSMKRHDIKRHHTTTHPTFEQKYPLDSKDRADKIASLLRSHSHSTRIMAKATTLQEKTTEASLRVSWILNKHKMPYTSSEVVKECMIETARVLSPNEVENYRKIPLSNDTNTRRSEVLAESVKDKLINDLKETDSISLAADESTDISDIAQLSLFVRYLDKKERVFKEELLALLPLTGSTTGRDIYGAITNCLKENDIPLEKITSLVTDGAPAMVGSTNGAAALLKQDCPRLLSFHCIIHNSVLCTKLKEEFAQRLDTIIRLVNFLRSKSAKQHRDLKSFLAEHEAAYHDVPLHTAVRWLSKGKVLSRVWELRDHIATFLTQLNKEATTRVYQEFLSSKEDMTVVAFLVDIFTHLNNLNLHLQGKSASISDVKSQVTAFQQKLDIFKEDLRTNMLHFPHVKDFSPDCDVAPFVEFIENLANEFSERFANFSYIDNLLVMVKNPFVVTANDPWLNQASSVCPQVSKARLQMEFVDMTADDELRLLFEKTGKSSASFWVKLNETQFSEIRTLALTVSSMFGTTYICEQSFSHMNMIKTRYRASMTNEHLEQCLRISVTSETPNFKKIVMDRKCNFSH